MRKYACKVAYDGSDFFGFQRQKEERTVQGELERFLSYYLGSDVSIKGAGRTDKGVHALSQFISFESPRELEADSFFLAADRLLPKSIFVLAIYEVGDSFHPRLSPHMKKYRYDLEEGISNPFLRNYRTYFRNKDFDGKRFEEALKLFEGSHDFSCFTGKEEDPGDYIRDIKEVKVEKHGNLYRISFVSRGFMRYQVRMMVGAAYEVATGSPFSYIEDRLSKKTDKLSALLGPEGLYLEEITYDEEPKLLGERKLPAIGLPGWC